MRNYSPGGSHRKTVRLSGNDDFIAGFHHIIVCNQSVKRFYRYLILNVDKFRVPVYFESTSRLLAEFPVSGRRRHGIQIHLEISRSRAERVYPEVAVHKKQRFIVKVLEIELDFAAVQKQAADTEHCIAKLPHFRISNNN